MKCKQSILWIILSLLCHCVSSEETKDESKEETNDDTKDDLTEAEAKDGLEIIKSIKKINEDGSYTIGYEADDGSFKIESRDVLGHIKGTYGYLDDDGEIKRVSYSSKNITDVLLDAASVVQRIPKTNRTYSHIRQPTVLLYNPTTQPPQSTAAIQSLPKKKAQATTILASTTTTTPPTTTTKKNNYGEYIKNNVEVARSTTNRPSVVYASSSTPRNILYSQRPPIRSSTITPKIEIQKSEGQIVRPERPTELPVYRGITFKNRLLEEDASTIKPVVEQPELRSNLLRRQLSQENLPPFDPRQHVLNLQQSLGEDSVDVYSGSLTTGTPRTLFTTTNRPRIVPSPHIIVNKPSANSIVASATQSTTEYVQEPSTTEVAVTATPSQIPLYQIPSAQSQQEHQQNLVAVRHPFHGGVVLVPYNQLRQQENHTPPNQQQYFVPNSQYLREIRPTPTPHPENLHNPVFIQRPPVLRSIPVQVDDNGYIRPAPHQFVSPTSYPIPITPHPISKQVNEIENEVDTIKPPVSTKDFQKLIELLILRQTRLEQANALLTSQRQRELNLQRYRGHPTPLPILVRRPQEIPENEPVTYISHPQHPRAQPFILSQPQSHHHQQPAYVLRPQAQETREVYVQDTYTPASAYTPSKRVPRLLHPEPEDEQGNQQYLPPQIREMLLLRMLQLAINPALPLEDGNETEDSTPAEENLKKAGVRNVEVLGEEEERKQSRSKRYRENEYY